MVAFSEAKVNDKVDWDTLPADSFTAADNENPSAAERVGQNAPKIQPNPPQNPRVKKWAPFKTDVIGIRAGTKQPFTKGWSEWKGNTECLARLERDGHSFGLLTRRFPAIDIDIPLPVPAGIASDLALEMIGPAPIRGRRGTGKRLLLYRATEGEVLRKRRFVFKDQQGTEHAVELLATGQQVVIDGVHPEGVPYEWDEEQFSPEDLTTIRGEQWDTYCRALAERLQRVAGCTVVKDGLGGAVVSGAVKRRGDEAPEPSVDPLAAMMWWKEQRGDKHDEPFGHDNYVDLAAAFRGAAGDHADELFDQFRELSPGGRDVDGNTHKTYHSFDSGTSLGWSRLCQITGFTPPDAFAEPARAEEMPEAPDGVALKKATQRYVYVRSQRKLYDAATGDFVDKEQFNDTNRDISPVGSAGTKSSISRLLNHEDVRKVATATYRPDKADELIFDEEHNGTNVKVVNKYRRSSLIPVRGADVTPWLDHLTTLRMPPGSSEREHFLDWQAYNVQFPGSKINHAIVMLGRHGIGKNTAFEPLLRAVGPHNCKAIKPEVLLGGFSHFLETQLIIIEEMMNFEKRAVCNKLKDWLASTPSSRVEVNKKHQQPYSIPCIQNWIITTNHADAIALEETERRFWVHDCGSHEPDKEHLRGLWKWFDDQGGVEACVGYLLKRDIASFDPYAAPPETEAKREMLRNTQPRQVRWLCEQFREDGALEGRTVLAAGDLKALASRQTAPKDIDDKHAMTALRLEGFKKSKRGRIGKNMRQLWTNNPKLDQSSWEMLKAQYEKQATGGVKFADDNDKEGAWA
jgi:hypothetical protein